VPTSKGWVKVSLEPEHHEQAKVALVLFWVGPYRAALEACHVFAMTERPTELRTTNAHSLLYEGGNHQPQPSRWLTLRDTQAASDHAASTWQLGVDGDITLQHLPASTLYPLPKLLQSRHFSPALCGFTFEQQQLVLLLDAGKLSLHKP